MSPTSRNSEHHLHFGHHPRHRESSSSDSSSGSASNVTPLSQSNHKHYHQHISTPYPDHSSSHHESSFLDARSNHHHPHISNPITGTSHYLNHHANELQYGHASRAAKREARRSQGIEHMIPEFTEAEAATLEGMHGHEHGGDYNYSESVVKSREVSQEDREAWQQELERRERARHWRKPCDCESRTCEHGAAEVVEE